MFLFLKKIYRHLPAPLRRLIDLFFRGQRVRLDISSKCQLRCPGCPTGTGEIARTTGNGTVAFGEFEQFVSRNKEVSEIELSNWGEVFLNPDLDRILKCAREKHIMVTITNGANLNHASPAALEALVRYGVVREITCSIDGATQAAYQQYRVGGNLDRVLGHIDEINRLKKHYQTPYPHLVWQFVAFGHNEHEIEMARQMASDRDMDFRLKLSWGDLYGKDVSPVRRKERVRAFSESGAADRHEFEAQHGENYIQPACEQLWSAPQIHSDGRLWGCVINYQYDYGNVFNSGLKEVLDGQSFRRARKMLTGELEAQPEIPCSRCPAYLSRKKTQNWVQPDDLHQKPPRSRMANRLFRALSGR